MKILHATDLHYNTSYFDWITETQRNYDAICLTGDFLDSSHRDSLDTQIRWIKNWACSIKCPLFFCSGNHDENDTEDLENMDLNSYTSAIDEDGFMDPDPYMDYPSGATDWLRDITSINPLITSDGGITTVKGIAIGCIPYETRCFERYRSCDILLYHVPPAGLGVSKNKGTSDGDELGCQDVRFALESNLLSPKLVLSGHIHHPLENISKLGHILISNPGSKTGKNNPLFHNIDLSDQGTEIKTVSAT